MNSKIFKLLEDGDDAKTIEFIKKNPDTIHEKQGNQTALYLAAMEGCHDIVKALLDNNADVNAQDEKGRTPLWIAASKGEDEIVEMLLKKQASTAAKCSTCQFTTLHIAAQNRHLGVVKLLAQNKTSIDIDAEDANRETALSKAAANDDFEIAKELLRAGASKKIPNKDKKTLEDLAEDGAFGPEVTSEITGKPIPQPPTITDDYADNYEDDYHVHPYLDYMCDHVIEKKLQAFFGGDDDNLEESILPYAIQAEILVKELGVEKLEIAPDLALLTLYDLAILIDDSSSMRFEDGGARIKTLINFVAAIAHIYSLACGGTNGKIRRIRFLNSRKGGDDVDKAHAKELLSKHPYAGMTRIGTELKKKILADLVTKDMKKPLLVMIITDGEVQGENKGLLVQVIDYYIQLAASLPGGTFSLAFQFSRIGNDKGAKDMLEKLDNHKILGKHIDCQPADFDLESIITGGGKELFNRVTKLLIGAICESWDDLDNPEHMAHS